jgi:ketosteroid isomerase-like protein
MTASNTALVHTPAANAELVRRGYAAFARGDIPAALEVFHREITWHVPGRGPLSGDFYGHQGVLEFFGRCHELSGGTLRVVPEEFFLGVGDRVVALCTVSAERHGQAWSSPEVHVWRVTDGRAIEFVEYQADQQTEDEFWGS